VNLTLFKSRHAFGALLLVAAFAAWPAIGDFGLGARRGSRTDYVLWSGWTALAAMLAVTAYSARKYVHRFSGSPEFRLRATARSLERAEARLNDLRADVLRGKVRARSDAEALARRALKEEGAGRVLRAEVVDGPAEGPRFVIRVFPTEPLGRVATWLHVHAWYGLASGVLVWLHGGASFGSPLGAALNALTLTVILTGVLGILLWAAGPRWMTAREKDFTFEDAFVQNRSLKRKIAAARAKLEPATLALFNDAVVVPSGFREAATRAAAGAATLPPPSRTALMDALVLAGQRRRVQTELSRLATIKFWINLWRAVHVPATILLLGAAVVHVLQTWRY
jgi:hypothetical protein